MEAFKILLDLLVSFTREHAQRARQTAGTGNAVEYILVILGGIAIAGIVIIAITALVNRKTAELG
ncbi:MAG: hypothetical protein ACTH2X_00870 [Brachybacterium tyrofermentans]